MTSSRRPGPAIRMRSAFGFLLAWSVAPLARGGETAHGRDAHARISSEVVAEALVADEYPAFRRPPWLESWARAAGRGCGTSASASWVILSDELGAAERFAGEGAGVEFRLDACRPSGWGGAFAFSTVASGLYSVVDDRAVRVERYLLGAIRVPVTPARWRVAPGVGVAWSVFDVDGADPALDIEGAGGYAELRAVGLLGRRCRLEASGRAIYWRGKDGLGGSGAELSLVLGVGVGVRF